MKLILSATPLLLCLAACSPEPADAPDVPPGAANRAEPPAASPPSPPPPPSTLAPPEAAVLTLEGLGALKVGRKVPPGSGWAERGAQISDSCRTISSPAHPGVYAIVEHGKVARITVGQGSSVKLVEGVGVGAAESEVRAAFAGFREAPHKYSEAPAKYLTAPNADSGDPSLRFEIGPDGKVALIHVGAKPVLYYVEGCA
ncbi:MAG: hypothetical protein ABWX67_07855 [Allosphingosinicella sp.]